MRTTLTARRNKQLGVLIAEMILDCFTEQTPRVKGRPVGRGDDAYFALWNDRCLRNRYAEEVRMNGPQTRRQRAQLNALNAALLDESDRILKIVVRVLSAIEGEDSAREHGFTIDCFDNPQFIRADFN